jgi:hypothetical protein
MKKKLNKLTLAKETLRRLADSTLADVLAAGTTPPVTYHPAYCDPITTVPEC